MTQTIIQTLLGLGFVLALFLGIAWIMHRFGSGPLVSGDGIKIVSALALGHKEKLLVVEVGGKQLLLGVTAQQINTLHTFDELVIQGTKSGGSGFSSKLQAVLSQSLRRDNQTAGDR